MKRKEVLENVTLIGYIKEEQREEVSKIRARDSKEANIT